MRAYVCRIYEKKKKKKKRRGLEKRGRKGDDGGEEERQAEVVFVRATINSAGSVLPPKTYRNKYAVRPVRG